MNSLNLISLLIIGLLVEDAYGSYCQPIVKSPEIDFKRVFDVAPWYETYRDNNHEVAHYNTLPNIDCIYLTDANVLTDKILITTNINNNGSSLAVHYEILHNQTGVYRLSKKSETEIANDYLKLKGSERRIKEKDLTIGDELTLFLTDYVNYFILATCSSEGYWVTSMLTSTPSVTADQLNLARNKLAEYGICTQLYPTNCNKLFMKGLLE